MWFSRRSSKKERLAALAAAAAENEKQQREARRRVLEQATQPLPVTGDRARATADPWPGGEVGRPVNH